MANREGRIMMRVAEHHKSFGIHEPEVLVRYQTRASKARRSIEKSGSTFVGLSRNPMQAVFFVDNDFLR